MTFAKQPEGDEIDESPSGDHKLPVVDTETTPKIDEKSTESSLKEKKRKTLYKRLLLLAGIIFVTLMIVLWNINNHQLKANSDALVTTVTKTMNQNANAEHQHVEPEHQHADDGARAITIVGNRYDGGDHIYVHIPNKGNAREYILKCDVDTVKEADNSWLTIVSCGSQSVATVKLPFKR